MNNDLISRAALKKAIMNDLGLGDEENGSDAEYMSGLQDCYNIIDNAPSVEAYTLLQVKELVEFNQKLIDKLEERPQGEWKLDSLGAYCSECGTHPDYRTNFCPNCGASMQKGM